jgi:23S rRNA pseudouridine2605 synthase
LKERSPEEAGSAGRRAEAADRSIQSERLQKVLARAGVCSRRAAEKLILEGQVEVNGQVVRELGTKVDPAADRISVQGKAIDLATPAPVVVLVYKPVWMLTTWSDPRGRPTVRELVADLGMRLFPVGRLDFDAEGLLLLTNDGDLAYRLTHPRFQVRRTYLVKIAGKLSPKEIEMLTAGVQLEDGPLQPLEVTPVPHPAAEAEGASWYRIALAEGRNHVVKRLVATVGHVVRRLVRAEYGGLALGSLRPGQRRVLGARDVAKLQASTASVTPGPYPAHLDVPPSSLRAPAAPKRKGNTRALTRSGGRD